ncbi:MAG: laccase domain-containing protein, partial [Pseudomonadota bacterium]
MSAPPHLTARALTAAGLAHGFFGRAGGVSRGVYQSLNAGPGSNDDQAAVAANRARCAAAIGAQSGHLYTAYQVHSADVVVLDEARAAAMRRDGPPRADALVTATPGLAVGVLAADCMPWLMADPAAR